MYGFFAQNGMGYGVLIRLGRSKHITELAGCDARWEELLDACGAGGACTSYDEDSKDDNQQADLSMLNNNGASVFDFSWTYVPRKLYIQLF